MGSSADLHDLQELLADADRLGVSWEAHARAQADAWAPLQRSDAAAFNMRFASEYRPGAFNLNPQPDDAGYDVERRPMVAQLRQANGVPVTGVLRHEGPTTDLIVFYRRSVVSVARRVDHADGVPAAFGALHREIDTGNRIVFEHESYERSSSTGPVTTIDAHRKTKHGKTYRRLDADRLVVSSTTENGVESIWSSGEGVIFRRPLMTPEVFKAYASSVLRRLAARLHELVLAHRDPQKLCQGLVIEVFESSHPESVCVPNLVLLGGKRHLPPEEHWDAHEWESALTGGREYLDLPEYRSELKALAAEARAQGQVYFDVWLWRSVARHLNDLDWTSLAADETFAVVACGSGPTRLDIEGSVPDRLMRHLSDAGLVPDLRK